MNDMLIALSTLFASFWSFFIDINFPVLNIPFAYVFVGVFLIAFSIKLLGLVLGVSIGHVPNAMRKDLGE
jgi:hypothetical protein